MDIYSILFSLLILIGAAIAVFMTIRTGKNKIENAENLANQHLQAAEDYRNELTRSQTEAAVLRERITLQNAQQVKLQEEIDAERSRLLNSFEEERSRQNKEFTLKFENLANEILERKSKSMGDANRQSIGDMLKPFSESVERFRTRIEEESKQRFALENEVKRLAELNLRISKEAEDLTSALKGNSKHQGDWGEMILETLLESSGLVRDKHFLVQHSIRDNDGTLLRPDVILLMPDKKEIIIDSKVSLVDYVAYCSAEDDQERKRCMASHIASVRKHVMELGTKNYSRLVNSPNFVIMFIPNEPAYLLALQGDDSLWQEAYSRGVLLSSTTNFYAILKIIHDLWRRDTQSKNALEIARQGGELYDKFVLFAQTFTDVGSAIRKSEELYEKGLGQLSHGRGNLVARAEKLRDLGVKTSKTIPRNLMPDIPEEAPGELESDMENLLEAKQENLPSSDQEGL